MDLSLRKKFCKVKFFVHSCDSLPHEAGDEDSRLLPITFYNGHCVEGLLGFPKSEITHVVNNNLTLK